ncbi:alcohol oxidase [Vararia minispora EC-137]|uniref:Alcohol oxidase n=1 Tax=Vararia minispora EC-137 TaxID=1314806 RepID=A0ACB8QFF7_9AGAM|nr:alcohol oxidase [Vararia minispora EC-137]
MDSRLATVEQVSHRDFDYIIVGGGTAGLVLANRLSEDPSKTVLVLEAGGAHFDDPTIKSPASFGKTFGDAEYDWLLNTTPQEHSDGVSYYWARGKGLGGSSGVNIFNWERPSKEDINIWEELGNPGWNWKNYLRYSMRSERFIPPTDEEVEEEGLTYDMNIHGTDGPVVVAFPNTRSGFDLDFAETLGKHGFKKLIDPLSGSRDGVGFELTTINPATNTRSYSSEAYLEPILGRSNLSVLIQAFVTKITSSVSEGELIASGVEFIVDGKIYWVGAKAEVILSAGAIKSPQVLELSGIGDPAILNRLGIEVKLDLPSVGTNVQDHLLCGVSYELTDEAAAKFITLDPVVNSAQPEEGAEVHEKGGDSTVAWIAIGTNTLLAATTLDRAKDIQALAPKSGDALGLTEQYMIQHRCLDAPALEIALYPGFLSSPNLPTPGKKHISLCASFNRPFSRGTIHAASSNPLVNPEINPHYFQEKFDEECYVEQIKFMPREVNPGPDITDDNLIPWLRKSMGSMFHVIGSTAMLPREKGGVVDSQLRVYGTRNLRVVDLGVVPLHFAAHPQATVYAIAEQGRNPFCLC